MKREYVNVVGGLGVLAWALCIMFLHQGSRFEHVAIVVLGLIAIVCISVAVSYWVSWRVSSNEPGKKEDA